MKKSIVFLSALTQFVQMQAMEIDNYNQSQSISDQIEANDLESFLRQSGDLEQKAAEQKVNPSNKAALTEFFIKNSATHLAAKQGNLEVLRILAEWKIPLNTQDENLSTPLHHACKKGYARIIYFLTNEKTVAINAANSLGKTPLHYAAKVGNPKQISILLKAGADPTACTKQALIPLHYAAARGNTKTCGLLIENDKTLLHRTTMAGGDSALHMAASQGWIDTVDLLISEGADLDLKNSDGFSSLHAAVYVNKNSLVKHILNMYAPQIDSTNCEGHTALHTAILARNSTLTRILIKYKANLNCTTPDGKTPLHLAAQAGSSRITQHLLEAGANPDATIPCSKTTPLHTAVFHQQPRVFELLYSKTNLPESEKESLRSFLETVGESKTV